MKSTRIAVAALLAAGGLFTAGVTAASTTETVTEANLGVDWGPNVVGVDSGLAFVPEYGAPSGLGSSALQLVTENASTARAEIAKEADVPLSDVGSLSYWTYQSDHAANPENAAVAYKMYVTWDGGWTFLVYEPYWQNGTGDPAPVLATQWQQWANMEDGNWWSSRTAGGLTAGSGGPPFYSIADVLSLQPDARVQAIVLGIGSYNPDWVVAADGMTFAGTTYNFEQAPTPVSAKDECFDGGWETTVDGNGAGFVNQGDCVSYVASDGKTRGPK